MYDYKETQELKEVLKKFKGQPIEVITESGFKCCGIDVEADDNSVVIIDDNNRVVRLLYRHIDAVIQPQMRLKRICKDCDCDCDKRDRDDCKEHDHH